MSNRQTMERSEIIETVRLGKHYIEKAEQARWRVMESHHRYEEAMSKLDKLRRRMVFVESGTPENLELVSAIIEVEEARKLKNVSEIKLKNSLTSSFSYTLSAYESMSGDSSYVANQILSVLRQAVLIIRSVRELSVDFSSILAQVIRIKFMVFYSGTDEGSVYRRNILRHLNQLINSIE